MRKTYLGQILIECPSSLFLLYVKDETEASKIQTFMKNIQSVNKMELRDIHTWCNRQGIDYATKFRFHKEFTLDRTLRAFLRFFKLKMKYEWHLLPV